jgi:hypothetical protein
MVEGVHHQGWMPQPEPQLGTYEPQNIILLSYGGFKSKVKVLAEQVLCLIHRWCQFAVSSQGGRQGSSPAPFTKT